MIVNFVRMAVKPTVFITHLLIVLLCVACAGKLFTPQKEAKALRELGEAYVKQGDYTSALRELLHAKEINANDPYLYDDLGQVYMAKLRFDLAIENFKKAIELRPEFTPAKNNLGSAYLAKQDWDAAIEVLNELSGDLLYATPHYPLANLGWAYYNKKDFKKAKEYYLKSLKIDPNFVIAIHGLAKTYIELKNYSQAIEQLKKAILKDPYRPDMYLDLGKTYSLVGEKGTKSVEAYTKVIELAPDSEFATEAKTRLEYYQNTNK
ncbi:MAG: tetratricopeptide repeat protein [Desulfobacterales bacterium]|nr:tetratricopeptide repeat protein [Desulfobacterales bacterium]